MGAQQSLGEQMRGHAKTYDLDVHHPLTDSSLKRWARRADAQDEALGLLSGDLERQRQTIKQQAQQITRLQTTINTLRKES